MKTIQDSTDLAHLLNEVNSEFAELGLDTRPAIVFEQSSKKKEKPVSELWVKVAMVVIGCLFVAAFIWSLLNWNRK